VHFVRRQLRAGDEQVPSSNLVRQHFPALDDFGRERARDGAGNDFWLGFSERNVLLQAERSVHVGLANLALRDQEVPQPDTGGLGDERRFYRGRCTGTPPAFAQLADLFDERGAVGIRMLGLEPNEREIRGLRQSRFRAVRVWVARERVGTLGAGEIVIAERDI